MKVATFQCDKCGETFARGRRALEKAISFDGQRGPRTLAVDLLYRYVHREEESYRKGETAARAHHVDFCDNCLLWLIEEYKGSIMVAVGREENVTEDSAEHVSA